MHSCRLLSILTFPLGALENHWRRTGNNHPSHLHPKISPWLLYGQGNGGEAVDGFLSSSGENGCGWKVLLYLCTAGP